MGNMFRVDVRQDMLRWARERANLTIKHLEGPFPQIERWESGEVKPTLKQLEKLAHATHVPIGYLFLSEPPIEKIPIPDFRTRESGFFGAPSPNLLEMLYVCEQRQAWYHDFAKAMGEEPPAFIGSVRTSDSIEDVALRMRQTLGFNLEERRDCPSWSEALRQFIYQVDESGVLVMCSGVVLNNNRRRLNPEEFRGFAMADDLAPLVFINGADTKAAQMFTLAHELAHLWLGESALSDSTPYAVPEHNVERWCNLVSAEMLVPFSVLLSEFRSDAVLETEVSRLARHFKVSTLVILRRVYDAGGLSREEFEHSYAAEVRRIMALPGGKGGDFYLTQASRVSKRFARALVVSTLEGQTLYRDAFRMLGIHKTETFHELARNLEFTI
jgi:Zn-dependent peptidase ImmA (M78 family)/transcriptional regulator with XRE-family HTH domain